MRKSIRACLAIVLLVAAISAPLAYAASDQVIQSALQQAEAIHAKAMSDIIYEQSELKALYFQNVAIIQLLEDVKGLLKQNLETKKQ